MHAKKRKELMTGRGTVGKTAVAGVKDRETRRIRAAVMKPDGPALKTFVESHTEDGAVVYTDESTSYRGMPNHEAVTHGIGEYVRGQVSINGMESFWAMLKRGYVGVFHKMPVHAGGPPGGADMRIRSVPCATCIYDESSPLREDLPRLEAAIADPTAPGHFRGWRICHTDGVSCCAGFAERHGDNCTPIQLARRLAALLRGER